MKTKIFNVLTIITFIIIVVGFVMLLTRKQTLVAETGEIKTTWKKLPAADDAEDKKAA
jgi:hypothetical protein